MTSNPVTGTGGGSSATNATGTNGATNIDSMFMQLLITQLKNQDPLSPMDPSTFVQQLAQVTSLDQLTQINQVLQNTFGSNLGGTNSTSGGQ